MASVSSLDKDLRKVRLDKFTPAAANEVRAWIEEVLGERLPSSDLLEGLKDGVALCKLINLAIPPPGVKFKQSAMPFVQMENISIFLRACQQPPLNLHQHDTFLTVDLYEQKDPAQVLQCIGAFSRAANAANPSKFPTAIGPGKARNSVVSPQRTGPSTPSRDRGTSFTSNASSAYGGSKPVLPSRTGDSASGRLSPTKSPTNGSDSPGNVSSWSRREHEGATSPAWNIAQYGYMGGASQGNLGIAFGARRQITSSGPSVPSLAEKERMRKEKEAEDQRQRQEAEEAEQQRRAEAEAEEKRARIEEERRWEEETQRQRQEERQRADEEKKRWEEEERQWKLTEEKRREEEREAEARLEEERSQTRSTSDARLRGQFLSQYRAEQKGSDGQSDASDRVKQLEKELELARQREAEYERERQERHSRPSRQQEPADAKARARSRSRAAGEVDRQASYIKGEREFLQTKWNQHQEETKAAIPEPVYEPVSEQVSSPPVPAKSPRPLPEPTSTPKIKSQNTGGRPLPDPAKYTSPPQQNRAQFDSPASQPGRSAYGSPASQPTRSAYGSPASQPIRSAYASPSSQRDEPSNDYTPPPAQPNRTERFLSSNPAPQQAQPQQTYSRELGATAEQDAEDRRRVKSQSNTKAGGWASKSLLEREMEMERQRQREWEEAQKETAAAARTGDGVDGIGGGVGGRWDVGQWSGFTGGDSQNRGSQGIGSGRRQIVGPRPLPGSK